MLRRIVPSTLLAISLVAVASADSVPATALQLTLDGHPLTAVPRDPSQLAVYNGLVPILRQNGFLIVPTTDTDTMVGRDELRAAGVALLHLNLRAPEFTFNVVLLPPRWSKTKVGEVRLEDPRTGETIWAEPIKVPLSVKEGAPRRQAGITRLGELLGKLRPSGRVRSRDPMVGQILALNDVEVDGSPFLELARGLVTIESITRPGALVEIAADPRMRSDTELRLELLRRAVVTGGPSLERRLGAVLAGQFLAPGADAELTELLFEALGLIGADPGKILAPHVQSLSLDELLAVRQRVGSPVGQRGVDLRIAELALDEIKRARSFDRAEQLVRRLPMSALALEHRLALRAAMHDFIITPKDAASLYPRLERMFPEGEYPPIERDHVEEVFAAGVDDLETADVEAKLAYYRDYLRYAPRGAAADRLAARLGIEERLFGELVEWLRRLDDSEDERAALHAIYGPDPGTTARAAFGAALVAALGDRPADDAVEQLVDRHPEVPEVQGLARRRGLVPDRDSHTFPVAVGDSEAEVVSALGQPNKRRDSLTRRDLSPAAMIVTSQTVPKSKNSGFAVLEYKDRARVLLKDGIVFRVLVEDTSGRYHHGVRTGATRSDLLAIVGEPTDERAFMFGREALHWSFDGGRSRLTAILDSGRTTYLYEEDRNWSRDLLKEIF